MRSPFLTALLPVLLLLPLAVAPAAADEEQPDRQRLERRIELLEQRLASPGTGLLARAGQSVARMEDLVQRGEYRQFHGFVEREIIAPWRQVESSNVVQLSQSPPPQLTAGQRAMVKRNGLLVRQINTKLRRARRLLTRVEKLSDESHRRFMEIERGQARYVRLVEQLAQIDPGAAARRRAWLDTECRPRGEELQDRRRLLSENLERLLHWSDDPSLRGMLRDLGRVNRALESLRREFRGSLRG